MAAGTQIDVPLPSLGSGVGQVLVMRWLVEAGSNVRKGEPLVELRSPTADFGLQSPCDARIVGMHVGQGKEAAVGKPLVRIMLLQDVRAPTAAQGDVAPASNAAGAAASAPPSPVEAATHILQLKRALVHARRERPERVNALIVGIMRTYNEQGWFKSAREFYDKGVEESEAHGEALAVEYWRAEDALQAQQGGGAQQAAQHAQQAAQQAQQAAATAQPAEAEYVPPPGLSSPTFDASSPSTLYVRRAPLPGDPAGSFVPVFGARNLFNPEDAHAQSGLVWLVVGVSVLVFLYFNRDFYNVHVSSLGGDLRELSAKLHKSFAPSPPPSTRFTDVCGCDEAKADLADIVDYLKNPEKYTKLGGKMPKGILLLGPPGTGKTLLARAVAGEANVPFFAVSGSDFEEQFHGLGAQRVRTLFASARRLKRAIIFIDEIDTIGGKRETHPADVADNDRAVLNQLLSEMDGFATAPGVIVIAATNYAETLDPALLRPGRFDRHVVVPLPDIKGRREILELYARRLKLAPDVNLGLLARGTAGMTGADLSQLLNAAALRASACNQTQVSVADLEHAKDTVRMGLARPSGVLSPEMRRHLAYYHAGRSLVSLHTRASLPVHKVTLMQRGESLGAVSLLPTSDEDQTSSSYAEMLARLDQHMGGRVAEELVYGEDEVSTHAAADLQAAASLARQMVMQYGFGASHGPVADRADDPGFAERASDASKRSVDAEVKALLDTAHARAVKLLRRHQAELHRVAEALIAHETLDGQELKAVAAGQPISKPRVDSNKVAAPA